MIIKWLTGFRVVTILAFIIFLNKFACKSSTLKHKMGGDSMLDLCP